MKQSFKNLFKVHLKYIDFLLEKTLFSHQYVKSIKSSGEETEEEIRNIIRSVLPKRFKVTHGYIVSSPNQINEPLISPQVDLLIVDTLVPHSLFAIDKAENGSEMVPIEAVVGVFEIKRTINSECLANHDKKTGALYHLRKVIDSVGIIKTNQDSYLPGGIVLGKTINGGISSNPIIGIIGLEADNSLYDNEKIQGILSCDGKDVLPELDILASLGDFVLATQNPENEKHFQPIPVRETGVLYRYRSWKPESLEQKKLYRAAILSFVLGFVLIYLSRTGGKLNSLENYFFNESLKK